MITIICAGSRGDFQPYIALAQQLKKLDIDVRISGSTAVESLVRSYGIDYFPVETDFEKLGVDPDMIKEAQSADNPLKMLLTFNKMKKYGIKIAEGINFALTKEIVNNAKVLAQNIATENGAISCAKVIASMINK